MFLCSISLPGAFCRLHAHTIGFCVHGLRNAVRWQGSGIAAWWGRGGCWVRKGVEVRMEGVEGAKGRRKGRHSRDGWRVVMGGGGWPPITVPGAQRLQGSTGCPGFCMVTRADERLTSSVYTQQQCSQHPPAGRTGLLLLFHWTGKPRVCLCVFWPCYLVCLPHLTAFHLQDFIPRVKTSGRSVWHQSSYVLAHH